MSVIQNTEPKRDEVLYVRIQEKNKTFLEKQAKKSGFADVATFLDAALTILREKGIIKLKK